MVGKTHRPRYNPAAAGSRNPRRLNLLGSTTVTLTQWLYLRLATIASANSFAKAGLKNGEKLLHPSIQRLPHDLRASKLQMLLPLLFLFLLFFLFLFFFFLFLFFFFLFLSSSSSILLLSVLFFLSFFSSFFFFFSFVSSSCWCLDCSGFGVRGSRA